MIGGKCLSDQGSPPGIQAYFLAGILRVLIGEIHGKILTF